MKNVFLMPSGDEHFGNIFLNIQPGYGEEKQYAFVSRSIAEVDHLVFTSPDVSTSVYHF